MYNLVMGDGHEVDRGRLLISLLGNPHVARFRDAWVEKDEAGNPVIAIYTRTGGGNRECYCERYKAEHVPTECYAAANEELAQNPFYLRDTDDKFDNTYATFYFRVPDRYQEILAEVSVEHVDMDKKWAATIEALKKI